MSDASPEQNAGIADPKPAPAAASRIGPEAQSVRDRLAAAGVTARLSKTAATLRPVHLADYHGRGTSALATADGSIALIPVLERRGSKLHAESQHQQLIWRSSDTFEIASRSPDGAWTTHGRVAIQGNVLVALDRHGNATPTGVESHGIGRWHGIDVIVPPGGEVSLQIDPRKHLEFAGGMNRVTMADVTLHGSQGEQDVVKTGVLKVVKYSERSDQIADGYLTASEAKARNPRAPVPVTYTAGYSDDMMLGVVGKRSFFAVEEFMTNGASLQDFLKGEAKLGGVKIGPLAIQDAARLTSVAAKAIAELNVVQDQDGKRHPAQPGERIAHTDLKPDNIWISHDPGNGGWSATVIDKDAFLREGRQVPGGSAHQSARYGDVVIGNELVAAEAKSKPWDLAEQSMVAQLAAGMLMPYQDCAPQGDDSAAAYTAAYKDDWIAAIRAKHQPHEGDALDAYLNLVHGCVSWDWEQRPGLQQFADRLDHIADLGD